VRIIKYNLLTVEEKREYHRLKHKEYRDRNRERYRQLVRKSQIKYYLKKGIDLKKERAKRILNNNIMYKKITRKNCIFCENENAEGHHKNYNEPLNVIWMCKHCHEKFHQITK